MTSRLRPLGGLAAIAVVLMMHPASAQTPPPLNAMSLALGPVQVGQQVRAEGRPAGSGAMRVERLRARDVDDQVRIESQISTVDPETGTLSVLGFVVRVPSSARVVDGSEALAGVAALRTGERVEVRGRLESDGTVTANRVRRSPLVGTPRDEIEAPINRILDPTTFELLGRLMIVGRGANLIDERTGAPRGQLRRDDDEQQIEAIRLGSWGTLGGRVEGVFAALGNAALTAPGLPTSTRNSRVDSAVQLDFAANLGRKAQLYAKTQATRGMVRSPRGQVLGGDIRVKEANLRVHVAGPVEAQVGRIRLRDTFEWFADDYLDAARLVVNGRRTLAEFGVSYGVGGTGGRSRSDERQIFASLTHEFSRAFIVSSYLLGRDDRTRAEHPYWIFIETSGRSRIVRYWGHTALQRGRTATTTFGGWAFDAGATLRPSPRGLALTGRYAVGSGDADRSDSVNRTFTQTSLEDTETRLAGFKRIHNYGELLEPELSNLRVLTGGLGWQGTRMSLDTVHHTYWQHVPRKTPADSNLSLRPTGNPGRLGQELDVIFTNRVRPGVDLTFTFGTFVPGPAHATPAAPSTFWKSELQYFF